MWGSISALMLLSAPLRAIKQHPVMTLQIAAIAAVAAAVAFLWLDYRGTKADLVESEKQIERLETSLAGEQAARRAAVDRLQDFAEAQERHEALLDDLASAQANTRQQVAEMVERISAGEVNRIIEERPNEASDIISRRVNNAFGMFDNATAIPSAGSDRAAEPGSETGSSAP